jgi:hypothetical protein
MKNWRRYEILLPLRFNNGKRVPKALLAKTALEVEERFSAVSCESQIIQGRWRRGRMRFRDDLMRIYVDAETSPAVDAFFRRFKRRIKARFRQLDIWVTSHSIRIL